jgi:hypothetical protein
VSEWGLCNWLADFDACWESAKEDDETRWSSLTYYLPGEDLKPQEFSITFWYTKNCRGVDVSRFVDLRECRASTSEVMKKDECVFNPNIDLNKICYYKIGNYYYIERFGLFCKVYSSFDEMFLAERGLIYKPSAVEDVTMYYRDDESSSGNEIFAYVEMPRGIYQYDNDALCDYELNFNKFEFFQDIEKAYSKVTRCCREKIKKDYIHHMRMNKVVTFDMIPDKAVFEIIDSMATGNCEIGTKRFLDQYNIELNNEGKITLAELKAHKNWDEFSKNSAFKKVIFSKIPIEVLENIPAINEPDVDVDVDVDAEPTRERRARKAKTA